MLGLYALALLISSPSIGLATEFTGQVVGVIDEMESGYLRGKD